MNPDPDLYTSPIKSPLLSAKELLPSYISHNQASWKIWISRVKQRNTKPHQSQSILWQQYTYISNCKSWAVHPFGLNTCMTVKGNEKPFSPPIYGSFCEFLLKMATTLPTCIMPTSWSVNFHQPPTSTTDTIWALRFNPIQANQPPEPHSAKYILLFPFQESLLPSQGFRTLLRVSSSSENRFLQMTWQTDL